MNKKLILASSSPRRRELLTMLGWDFEVVPSNADENIDHTLPPDIFTQELAFLKAGDVAREYAGTKDVLIIGCDTIVSIDGKILEKPATAVDAAYMLKYLSGKTHEVYSGICVIQASNFKSECRAVRTAVTFRKLDNKTIEEYISTGEPFDKAGAYGIQGKGAILVEGIQGDFYNVVGLPIATLDEILNKEFGY